MNVIFRFLDLFQNIQSIHLKIFKNEEMIKRTKKFKINFKQNLLCSVLNFRFFRINFTKEYGNF